MVIANGSRIYFSSGIKVTKLSLYNKLLEKQSGFYFYTKAAIEYIQC